MYFTNIKCVFLILTFAAGNAQQPGFTTREESSYKASYKRVAEASELCPFGSSLSQQPDSDQGPDPNWVIQNELSFLNGDWFQGPNAHLKLIPFTQGSPSSFRPLQLASFWITDVNLRSKSGIVRVSAILKLAISKHRSISYYTSASDEYEQSDGFSALTALMEGIYFETATERGVCMVGCTRLPRGNSTGVEQYCDLHLELHFPQRHRLKSREVRGALRSEHVQVVSSLGAFSKYEFSSDEAACSSTSLENMALTVYHGRRFCSSLMEILTGQWVELSGTGPFPPNSTRMCVLDIRCIDFSSEAGFSVNVSMIFRSASPLYDPRMSMERTGLHDGTAFATEGLYKSSTGELCMVGCRYVEKLSCDVGISIYLPVSFSVRQRNVLFGRFTGPGFPPTGFGLFVPPRRIYGERAKELVYKYSRTQESVESAKLDESQAGLTDRIKLSMLKFPASNELMVQTGLLSRTANLSTGRMLDIQVLCIEDTPMSGYGEDVVLDMDYIRVAVEITVTGGDEEGIPVLPPVSAEGVYVQRTGKMHLVGCRRRNSSSESFPYSFFPGECGEKITVQYPPSNSKWMVSPTVKVYMEDTMLETFPILYGDQLHDILSRKSLESVLSALTLSLMTVCVVLQLLHVKKTTDSAPFVSLVMLGVQSFGFSVPLITGAEALFAKATPVIVDAKLSTRILLYSVKLLSLAALLLMLRLCQKVVRYRIRLSTKFPLEPRRVPSETEPFKRFCIVHSGGFLAVLLFHYLLWSSEDGGGKAYVTWDGKDGMRDRDWMKELKEYAGLVEDWFLLPQVIAASVWEIKGKPLLPAYYMGMTVLRMLPHVYHALNRPLFNPYFADEASVFANPKLDFYTWVGDLFIPLVAMGLAGAVYAQQRWNGLKWGRLVRQGSKSLMRYGSKLYERLPSSKIERLPSVNKFEAEMMPSAVEESDHESLLNGGKH